MPKRVFVLALLATTGSAAAASPTPLLDYALSQSFNASPRDSDYQRHLLEVQHELERNPPPAGDCATTLGAKRFAAIYDELGSARSNLADYDGAVEAFEKALTCMPRAAYLYAQLAGELIHLNRYVEARVTAERGLEVSESEASLIRILGQLDFIEERWSDAAEHFKSAIDSATDDEYATYWQCLLWLAQRRAGIERPQLVSRERAENWPQPILETLTKEITEPELVSDIKDERDENRRREILAEALYYLGQRRLADGELEPARRYFAATVNLKVHYFVEYHMALAELAKFRARSTSVSSNVEQRVSDPRAENNFGGRRESIHGG